MQETVTCFGIAFLGSRIKGGIIQLKIYDVDERNSKPKERFKRVYFEPKLRGQPQRQNLKGLRRCSRE